MKESASVWVFKGPAKYPGFPSAVFSNLNLADKWIKTNKLSGVLTKYPIDISIYDWVIQNNIFEPDHPGDLKNDRANFIANFSSAHQEHFHYKDGRRLN